MDESLIRKMAKQELPCADDWRRMWPSAVAAMWEAMSQAIGDMSTITNAIDRQQTSAILLLRGFDGFMARYSDLLQQQFVQGCDQLHAKADSLKHGLHSYAVEVITEMHAAHKQNLAQLSQARVESQETLEALQRTLADVRNETSQLAANQRALQQAREALRAEREAWDAERRLPLWRRLLGAPR